MTVSILSTFPLLQPDAAERQNQAVLLSPSHHPAAFYYVYTQNDAAPALPMINRTTQHRVFLPVVQFMLGDMT